MKRALGNLERQLFAYAQMRNLRAVRTRDLTGPLGISGKQERELLNRLAKAGMIVQVRRGLYLVPPRLPLGGKWSPEETLVLDTMDDRQGRYQICGPNAFNRYGFDLAQHADGRDGHRRVAFASARAARDVYSGHGSRAR